MDILIYLGLFLVSIIPSIILYKWLKKQIDDENYKSTCKKSLIKGILSIFPILLTSEILYIFGKIAFLKVDNELLYQVYYNFIVLAFAEELVKFLFFRKILKTTSYNYSWYSLTIFMVIIGIGFGSIENSLMAIGSNLIMMVIRAISMGHAGYGLIMGWLYGKMLKTKKKIYGVLSFIVPWLLHGLYDFGLTEKLLEINDNFAIISVSLELLSIIFVFLIIRFAHKKKNLPLYTEPLVNKQ